MRTSNGLCAWVACALLCGSAVGAETQKAAQAAGATKGGVAVQTEKDFRALDKDGDGYVSKSELNGHEKLLAQFSTADKDRDGKLDLAEFQDLQAEASPDRSLAAAPAENPPKR